MDDNIQNIIKCIVLRKKSLKLKHVKEISSKKRTLSKVCASNDFCQPLEFSLNSVT